MPRDRRRTLTDSDLIHALQSLRLTGLETGRFQPLSEHEEFCLRLFHLEAMQRRTDEAADGPPFTPSPETAISPA